MTLAIEEMRRARSEHAHKPDPLVGAVLVNPKRTAVGRAHRGEYRDGEHGEYTLLEQVLGGTDVSGCTLYVTLEPCINIRRPPKKACAVRIVERGLRRVVVGMFDPNPAIHRRGVAYLVAHGIEVGFFDPDLVQAILQDNSEFIAHYETSRYLAGEVEYSPVPNDQAPTQSGSAKQIEAFKGPDREENRPILGATVTDLSPDAIREYLVTQRLSHPLPSEELWNFLRTHGLLAKRLEDEAWVPTMAGILLLGADPTAFSPDSKIKAMNFSGSLRDGRRMEQLVPDGVEDITGPLGTMVDKGLDFFRRHVRRVLRIEGSRRVRVPEYPEKVIRELLVNAVIHRSYLPGRDVTFEMYSDRIVVTSPGRVPPPVTVEDLCAAVRLQSVRRNPRLADAFSRLERMELAAFGIATIHEELRKHGLRKPDFREDGERLVVTLYGAEADALLGPEILRQLTRRQRDIVDHARKRGRITSLECERRFGISRETANQDFRRLLALGVLERKGTGRATYYVLVQSEER